MVNIEFELEEYVVRENDGSVLVCVRQTSSPPVEFARDVTLTFNTMPGTATGKGNLQNQFVIVLNCVCMCVYSIHNEQHQWTSLQ